MLPPPAGERPCDPRVEQARALLAGNSALDLDTVARRVGLSPWRLEHLFATETGVSFRDFRVQIKMDRVPRLLSDEEKSIKQVAYELGYKHPSSLTRAFRACFEFSPAEYRKRLRQALLVETPAGVSLPKRLKNSRSG